MLQAAISGAVDFRTFDMRKPGDQAYLTAVLNALVTKHKQDRYLARLQYDCAKMQSATSGSSLEVAQKHAIETLDCYESLFTPWLGSELESAEKEAVLTLKENWEAAFGDMDDPETQQGIRDTVEQMKAMRAEKAERRGKLEAARRKLLASEAERHNQRRQRQRNGR